MTTPACFAGSRFLTRAARRPSQRPRLTRLACAITAAVTIAGGLIVTIPAVASAEGCPAVDVVVARGTDEPGYLGAAVGDPLFAQLADTLPMDVDSYRVNYPANLLDITSVGTGSRDLVAHLVDRSAACPWTRFVIAGYSQGAVVVHTALGTEGTEWIPLATRLPAELSDRVAVVLLFGDPMRLLARELPDPFRARAGSWCVDGDPVCQPGGTQMAAHVAYGGSLADAALFAAQHL